MQQKLAKAIQDSVIDVLKKRRKKRGLSHEKLAALAGIHRTAVSHIENGRRNPSFLICLKLAQALGYRLSEVLKIAEARKKL